MPKVISGNIGIIVDIIQEAKMNFINALNVKLTFLSWISAFSDEINVLKVLFTPYQMPL